jgi:hypothetical protein
MIFHQSRPVLVVACCTATLLATGCGASVSVGKKDVPKAKVEAQVAERLAAKFHQPQPAVSCPSDLRAKVGARLTCILVAQGDTAKYPVTVTVTSAEDGVATFTIEVAKQPE